MKIIPSIALLGIAAAFSTGASPAQAAGPTAAAPDKPFIQKGSNAIARPLAAKMQDTIDAADYISVPGASAALDRAGVQKAINEAAARGGGRVRLRKPISHGWNLSLLTIPKNVLIDDERYSDAGHTVMHGTGTDVELRIHGASLNGGEGPSFVAVNNAATGDRTASLVSRYGAGAGASVGMYMHMGVWDGANWFPEYDMIASGADGFRSNLRVGYGTVQINAAYPGARQYTQNKIFSVNKPAALGGGNLLEVNTTAARVSGELHVESSNAAVRFYKAGAPKWSFISEFASAGQFSLYDHATAAPAVTFSTGAGAAFAGPVTFGGGATLGGNLVMVPAAAATPAAKGQMTFQLTNDTTLEIRVKGSDGVVRKVALKLTP